MKHDITLHMVHTFKNTMLYVECSCGATIMRKRCKEIRLDEIEEAKWRHLAQA